MVSIIERTVLVSVVAFIPILSACNLDHDYRMRTWERCRLQAQEYFLKGELAQAEEAYVQTIKQSEFLGRSSYYYGISLMCLGEFYRSTQKYEQARDLLKKALAVLLKCVSSSEIDKKLLLQNIARTESWIGDTYLHDKNYEQAERFYRDAVFAASAWRIKGTCSYEDHLLGQTVALSVYKLALIYENCGRLSDSLRCYTESLYIAETSALPIKLKDRIVEDYKAYLNSVGQTEKALSLEADKNCQEHMDRMEIYYRKQEWQKAEVAGKAALQAAEQVDPHDWRIVTILKDLLRIYINSGRYAEAEEACRRRLQICRFHKAAEEKIARSTSGQKDRSKGTQIGAQELPFGGHFDPQAKMIEHNDLRIAECLALLAYIYERTGRRAQARQEADRTYETLMKLGSEKRYAMSAIQQLCDVFFAEGDWQRARLLIKESLLYCSNGSEGCTHCLFVWRLYCANLACYPNRQFSKLLHQAQECSLCLENDEKLVAGIGLNNLAAICVDQKQFEAAKSMYQMVMRLGRSLPRETGKEILETARSNYAGILKKEAKK